jgi:hypothetical protein
MARIDTRALDEAVKRFPTMLARLRETVSKGYIWHPTEVEHASIVREYHLVCAERDKSATLALR